MNIVSKSMDLVASTKDIYEQANFGKCSMLILQRLTWYKKERVIFKKNWNLHESRVRHLMKKCKVLSEK